MKKRVVITGGGPAGLTAAIYTARAGLAPVVLSGPLPGGLLTQTTDIENFPGFPQGINGFELMTAIQEQAQRFGAEMLNDTVEKAELTPGGPQKLILASGEILEASALIVAAGASPRALGLESEAKYRNKGVSYCAVCDGAFCRDMEAAVIGGGDSAMEDAIFLTRFATHVTIVHRRNELRASRIMAERAKANPKISFLWDSVVEEVLGNETEMTGLRLRNVKTGSITDFTAQCCFVALGHVPNTAPFRDQLTLDAGGYIVLQGSTSLTNVPGVFACGDCADPRYRQAITAAGSGSRAGIDAERWLEENHL